MAAQAFGLEWLISDEKRRGDKAYEQEQPSDAEEEDDDEDAGDTANRRNILYLTMPSEEGLHKLLAMWNRFKANRLPTPSEKPIWNLFGYLNDLRAWSAQDRVDPGVTKYIEARLRSDPDRPVTVELDFWYRSEKQRRDKAIATLRSLLTEVKGSLLDLVEIPEIKYQGALVSIPASVAQRLSQKDGRLATFDEVMTIRPQSEFSVKSNQTATPLSVTLPTDRPSRQCITAILDGYPITAHQALNGRVQVHEVEVTSEQVPVNMREHGTAMASLITHGDLHSAQINALSRPVVMVPVLTNSVAGRETTPNDKLAIGVIYRAVNRLLQNPANDQNLSDITIINHSLCDTNSPFVRRPSPWAALLDHYSHHHRLLFIVSAGNITSPFPVETYTDLAAFKAAPAAQREAAIILAIERSKGTRGILSPAESVNNLTVGAIHAESIANPPQYVTDPYPVLGMTNLASATGFGVNRSIKPDLVEQGGRFGAQAINHPDGHVEVYPAAAPDLGHGVAAPSATGALNNVIRTAGTSNAAALVTRTCNQIADAVEDTFKVEGINWLTLRTRVPILKALISHGCSWGDIGTFLEENYPPSDSKQWSKRRDTITKFLGYGRPQFDRVVNGAENRVTLLAEDQISHEEMHPYQIPLPKALFNTNDLRSITITLAWTTPIVTTTADYRGVLLQITKGKGTKEFWDGTARSGVFQPNGRTSERGTLIHLRLEGRKVIAEALRDGMFIGVQARSTHPSQEKAPAPYALAITLEMAQSQKTNLYVDVATEIQNRANVRSTVRTPTRVKG